MAGAQGTTSRHEAWSLPQQAANVAASTWHGHQTTSYALQHTTEEPEQRFKCCPGLFPFWDRSFLCNPACLKPLMILSAYASRVQGFQVWATKLGSVPLIIVSNYKNALLNVIYVIPFDKSQDPHFLNNKAKTLSTLSMAESTRKGPGPRHLLRWVAADGALKEWMMRIS